MGINERYARLLNRRAPIEDRVLEKYAEAYEREVGEHTRYLLGAMKPVEAKYTRRLLEQGDRIENQLRRRLAESYPGMAFRRQGSVSNQTHIRFYSDIDVLTIIDKFTTLEPPQRPDRPYRGDAVDDLEELRQCCVAQLESAFPKAEVDDSGSTSVCVSGGSLACKVDVVPANWYDTVAYNSNQGEHTRGIMVLNREERRRKKNYPFLFNFRLDRHDGERLGVPRMLIRLLKSVKADYDDEHPRKRICFSSFDICSLVYRMPDEHLTTNVRQPLSLVRNLLHWLYVVMINADLQRSLKVIDDSRPIFDDDAKAAGLRTLYERLLGDYHAAITERGTRHVVSEAHLATA